FSLDYPSFGRQTVFWGECLKIQKRQLTRNELVALNFIILGISRISIAFIAIRSIYFKDPDGNLIEISTLI
ncbi:hypothetical protein ACR75W_20085, partial [Bacteroides thetaiotaomicron]